jgi:mannose-6-phosphate isomerase-like protein (cupin superfamily)
MSDSSGVATMVGRAIGRRHGPRLTDVAAGVDEPQAIVRPQHPVEARGRVDATFQQRGLGHPSGLLRDCLTACQPGVYSHSLALDTLSSITMLGVPNMSAQDLETAPAGAAAAIAPVSTQGTRRITVRRFLSRALAVAAAYVVVGALMDSVMFPEAAPGPEYYPREGYRFSSRSEGFHQTVLKREHGRLWIELEIEPFAPGPPVHVHTSIAEHFVVAEGTLSILFGGEKRVLRAGEHLLVPPGTPHRPFNETGARVVVRGPMEPDYALPDQFGVFLTQAYGFFDESPAHRRPPGALLQMSRFAPLYGTWLASPSVSAQQALFFLIRPTARLLGYRTHYEKYLPRG